MEVVTTHHSPLTPGLLIVNGMSRFKTALHSVSYAGVWTGPARLALPDFLRKARSLGFDGVMLMAKRPHLSVLDHDARSCAELGRLLRDLQLKVVCLAGYNDFTLGSDRPD